MSGRVIYGEPIDRIIRGSDRDRVIRDTTRSRFARGSLDQAVAPAGAWNLSLTAASGLNFWMGTL